MGTGSQPLPIIAQPGMFLGQSILVSKNRITAGSGIRFFKSFPEKRAGYQALTATAVFGIPRGSYAWSDLTGLDWIGVGTAYKLYAIRDDTWRLTDITPYVTSDVSGAPATGEAFI